MCGAIYGVMYLLSLYINGTILMALYGILYIHHFKDNELHFNILI